MPFPRSFVAACTLTISLASLVACGGTPPPEVPSPRPTDDAKGTAVAEKREAPSPSLPCSGAAACAEEGKARLAKGDAAGARESLGRACHAGDVRACTDAGLLFLDAPRDLGRASAMLVHACSEGKGDADGCALLAGLESTESETPADELLRVAEAGCKPGADDARRKKARAEACAIAGAAYEKSVGATADLTPAARAYTSGCELGSDAACRGKSAVEAKLEAERRARAEKDALLPGANLNAKSVTGNGFTLDELACKTEGLGGFLGATLGVAAAFAPKKARIEGCATKKTEVVVRWTARGGAMSEVKASGATPPVHVCVERALAGTKVPAGTCAARFTIKR